MRLIACHGVGPGCIWHNASGWAGLRWSSVVGGRRSVVARRYYTCVLFSLIFGSMQSVQDALDDPFDGIAEDDIDLHLVTVSTGSTVRVWVCACAPTACGWPATTLDTGQPASWSPPTCDVRSPRHKYPRAQRHSPQRPAHSTAPFPSLRPLCPS